MHHESLAHFKIPRRVSHIHFVGIGGSGMAGIAEVLLGERYKITGSDLSIHAATKRLSKLGATVFEGHNPHQIMGADVLVKSTAVCDDNPEIQAALSQGIPVISRAEMLSELMRFRLGIAVAGTHGKTTTTSMLATIFFEAEFDPTFVIGGKLNSIGSHARLGRGPYLIAEADESDASFLHLLPMTSVVTNIDEDHLSTYGGSFEMLKETFVTFLQQLPFYGLAVLCADDHAVKAIMPKVARPVKTYGFHEEADVRAINVKHVGPTSTFTVETKCETENFSIQLKMPGRHNILNALAAITVALYHRIPVKQIVNAMAQFQGVQRRFAVTESVMVGDVSVTLVDDYGHHPSELLATFSAAREAWPDKRIVWVFQPHRYTRTRDCFDAFCSVLSKPDCLVLLDVYPAGEVRIAGADGRALFDSIDPLQKSTYHFVSSPDEALAMLSSILQDGDMLLVQGAGSIKQLVAELAKEVLA